MRTPGGSSACTSEEWSICSSPSSSTQSKTWPPRSRAASAACRWWPVTFSALGVGREAEADERRVDVVQLEDLLLGDHLDERPVRGLLAGHRPRADALEAAVDAHRVDDRRAAGEVRVGDLEQLGQRPRPVDRDPHVGRERDDDRERRALGRRYGPQRAVDACGAGDAVDDDQLAVEPVERAQAEVAVLEHLADRHVPVVCAVEQRADRRGLKDDVRVVLGVQVGVAQRLHVQRADQVAVVVHGPAHGSLAAVPSIFSRIIAGEIPAHKLREDDRFLAFLDIRPIRAGHALVIPKQEIDELFDLPDDLLGDLFVFAKPVAAAIKAESGAARVGVAVVGIEVPHAHVHLVPLDDVHDIDFRLAKPADQDELAALAERLRARIDG